MLKIRKRKLNEIYEAEAEFLDRVWYIRHQNLKYNIKNGKAKCDEQIWKVSEKCARQFEKKYGKKSLGPLTDFEFGMINGKLSAIRWVLGEDWDSLDT